MRRCWRLMVLSQFCDRDGMIGLWIILQNECLWYPLVI
jgi:hypothetical protein